MGKVYTKCLNCGEHYDASKLYCPNCGEPIDTTIKCPKCGSANTRPISNNSKIGSMIMWGVFSANKVLNKNECLNCRHKF